MSVITHYFAYGSNMNPERVASRGLIIESAGRGELQDYRLLFDKVAKDHPDTGHANVEFCRDAVTQGVLYKMVEPEEILKMDPFERAPWNYGREVVSVRHAEGNTWAWTYFANRAVRKAGLYPSEEYLDHLLAGRSFLSDDYVQMLLAYRQR